MDRRGRVPRCGHPYRRFAPGIWTIALRHAGGGLAGLGAIGIDGDGNAWAANNIDLMEEVCLTKVPDETVSTRCGGNGFVVFFGLAKPVRTPVVGSQVGVGRRYRAKRVTSPVAEAVSFTL